MFVISQVSSQANVSAPLPSKNITPTESASSTSSSSDDTGAKLDSKIRELENRPNFNKMQVLKKELEQKKEDTKTVPNERPKKSQEKMEVDDIDELPDSPSSNESKKCRTDENKHFGISDESKDASDYEEPEIITVSILDNLKFSFMNKACSIISDRRKKCSFFLNGIGR